MRNIIRNNRGQFVIIAALLIAALTLTTAISIHEITVNRQAISYKPANEFLLGTTSDMNRGLTVALAKYTDSLVQNSGEPQAQAAASQFMSTWKEAWLTSYSGYGISINPDYPNNLVSKFSHSWDGNIAYSYATIPYDYDAAAYGFMGWVGKTEKYVQLQVFPETVDTSNLNKISLNFQISQTEVNQTTPISDLPSNPGLETFKIGPYTPGQQFSPPNSAPTLVYLGDGKYSLTCSLSQIIDPTTQELRLDIATPKDNIWVSALIQFPPKVSTLLSDTEITIGQSVKDTVTVSGFGGTIPTGSVTFYYSTDHTNWSQLNTAELDNTGQATSSTYTPPEVGTYYFMAKYLGDSNNQPSQSGATEEPLTVLKLTPTVTTQLSSASIVFGESVTDSVTVSSSTFTPTGLVTFYYSTDYSTDLNQWSRLSEATLDASGKASSITYKPLIPGVLYFQARYDGDSKHNSGMSGVTEEQLRISGTYTNLSSSSISLGQSVFDSATVVPDNPSVPTGTVVYSVQLPGSSNWLIYSSATLNSTGQAISASYTPMLIGTYHFKASYLGDSKNFACESGALDEPLIVTKPVPQVNTILSSSNITLGQPIRDSVNVTGLAPGFPVPTGTVNFEVSTDGGKTFAQFGSTKTLANGFATSDVYLPSINDTYYFRASYNGDDTYNTQTSENLAEQLTVYPAVPGVYTLLSLFNINLGQSTSDTAIVIGNGSMPTGSVTFYYSTDLTNWNQINTATIDGLGQAVSDDFTPSAVGTYYFIANYSGDSNNPAYASNITAEPLIVNQAIPGISTLLSSTTITLGESVTDTVTVTGIGGSLPNPTGTVTFEVSTDGGSSWNEFGTNPKTLTNSVATSDSYTPLAAGTCYFRAVYIGDGNYAAITSLNTAEPLIVNPATPSISTTLSSTAITLGNQVTDSVTVTGLGGIFPSPTGTVIFQVSTDGGSTWNTFGTSKTLSNGVAASDSFTPLTGGTGTYYFRAVYSGDSNYITVTSSDTAEPLIVNPATPTVTTTLSQTSIVWSDSVSDKVTVIGLGGSFPVPTGYVTFWASNDSINWIQYGGPVALVGGSAASPSYVPASFAPAVSGIAYFQARYLGDSNYLSADSPPTSEPLTVYSGTQNPQYDGFFLDIHGNQKTAFYLGPPPTSSGIINAPLSNGQETLSASTASGLPQPIFIESGIVNIVCSFDVNYQSPIGVQVTLSFTDSNGHHAIGTPQSYTITGPHGKWPYEKTLTIDVTNQQLAPNLPVQTLPAGSIVTLNIQFTTQNRQDVCYGVGSTVVQFNSQT